MIHLVPSNQIIDHKTLPTSYFQAVKKTYLQPLRELLTRSLPGTIPTGLFQPLFNPIRPKMDLKYMFYLLEKQFICGPGEKVSHEIFFSKCLFVPYDLSACTNVNNSSFAQKEILLEKYSTLNIEFNTQKGCLRHNYIFIILHMVWTVLMSLMMQQKVDAIPREPRKYNCQTIHCIRNKKSE